MWVTSLSGHTVAQKGAQVSAAACTRCIIRCDTSIASLTAGYPIDVPNLMGAGFLQEGTPLLVQFEHTTKPIQHACVLKTMLQEGSYAAFLSHCRCCSQARLCAHQTAVIVSAEHIPVVFGVRDLTAALYHMHAVGMPRLARRVLIAVVHIGPMQKHQRPCLDLRSRHTVFQSGSARYHLQRGGSEQNVKMKYGLSHVID